jgi:hypothetical protein
MGYLYGHIENIWGILFPKRMEEKYGVLGEYFQEQVFLFILSPKSTTKLK